MVMIDMSNISGRPGSPSYFKSFRDAAGNCCEICHQPEDSRHILYIYYIDRNPENINVDNIALLCVQCERIFRYSNPEGLTPSGGLFAFALNRGLYTLRKP